MNYNERTIFQAEVAKVVEWWKVRLPSLSFFDLVGCIAHVVIVAVMCAEPPLCASQPSLHRCSSRSETRYHPDQLPIRFTGEEALGFAFGTFSKGYTVSYLRRVSFG